MSDLSKNIIDSEGGVGRDEVHVSDQTCNEGSIILYSGAGQKVYMGNVHLKPQYRLDEQ